MSYIENLEWSVAYDMSKDMDKIRAKHENEKKDALNTMALMEQLVRDMTEEVKALRRIVAEKDLQFNALQSAVKKAGCTYDVKPVYDEMLREALADQRICRVCGCTNECACMTESGPCWWVEEDLCSACVGRVKDGS